LTPRFGLWLINGGIAFLEDRDMSQTPATLARTLEVYRHELTEMLRHMERMTLGGNRRQEAAEHIQRARQAVGLARAALIGGEN
jgi:hypothetical protein